MIKLIRPLSTFHGCLPVTGLTHELEYHEKHNVIQNVKSSFIEIPINISIKNANGQYYGLIYNCIPSNEYKLFNLCAVVRKRYNVYSNYRLEKEKSINLINNMFFETDSIYNLNITDIWAKYNDDNCSEQIFILNKKMQWVPKVDL